MTARTDVAVPQALTEQSRANRVVTAAGEVLKARAVVSNLHPQLTFQKLVAPPSCRPTSASASPRTVPAPAPSA